MEWWGGSAIREGYWTLVIGQNPCGVGPLGLGSLDSCDRGAVHRDEPWRHRRRGPVDDKSAFVEIDIGIRIDRHSDFERIDEAHFEVGQLFMALVQI
jgi:hypothetical protein